MNAPPGACLDSALQYIPTYLPFIRYVQFERILSYHTTLSATKFLKGNNSNAGLPLNWTCSF